MFSTERWAQSAEWWARTTLEDFGQKRTATTCWCTYALILSVRERWPTTPDTRLPFSKKQRWNSRSHPKVLSKLNNLWNRGRTHAPQPLNWTRTGIKRSICISKRQRILFILAKQQQKSSYVPSAKVARARRSNALKRSKAADVILLLCRSIRSQSVRTIIFTSRSECCELTPPSISERQFNVLTKSSIINNLKFPLWDEPVVTNSKSTVPFECVLSIYKKSKRISCIPMQRSIWPARIVKWTAWTRSRLAITYFAPSECNHDIQLASPRNSSAHRDRLFSLCFHFRVPRTSSSVFLKGLWVVLTSDRIVGWNFE